VQALCAHVDKMMLISGLRIHKASG